MRLLEAVFARSVMAHRGVEERKYHSKAAPTVPFGPYEHNKGDGWNEMHGQKERSFQVRFFFPLSLKDHHEDRVEERQPPSGFNATT